jgi:hypothetical protein
MGGAMTTSSSGGGGAGGATSTSATSGGTGGMGGAMTTSTTSGGTGGMGGAMTTSTTSGGTGGMGGAMTTSTTSGGTGGMGGMGGGSGGGPLMGQALWGRMYGDAAINLGRGVTTDIAGNSFVAGNTINGGGALTKVDPQGTLIFTTLSGVGERVAVNSAAQLMVAGNDLDSNAILVKTSAAGVIQWKKTIAPIGIYHPVAFGMGIDAADNVTVLIDLHSSGVNFGGGVLKGTLALAKFTSAGTHIWSKSLDPTTNSVPQSEGDLVVDAAGNIIAVGTFQGTLDFGGGPLSAPANSVFVVKFDPSGNHLWSKKFGSSDPNTAYGYAVGVDAQGNVFVGGTFWESVDFGGGVLMSEGGSNDAFLVKLDSLGNHLWSKKFGNVSMQFTRGVAAASNGDVVLTGVFLGTIDLGGGPLGAVSNAGDGFIARLSSTGQHLWSARHGGNKGEETRDVAVDSNGNCLVVGYSLSSFAFASDSLVNAGAYDTFLLKYGP